MPEANDRVRVTPELLRRHDRPGPRYTSYPTAVEFHDGVGPQEASAALARANELSDTPLSLYLHVPFCSSMCTFCGCTVVVRKDASAADPYVEHLLREIDLVAERLSDRRQIGQLHWGGGTPNYLSDANIERIFERIGKHFRFTADAEIALEIDPRHASDAQVDFLAGLGFNRVSMGVQDFTPEVQEAVNRVQPEDMTRAVYERCRERGFQSINLDLIYGLPLQTEETFQRTLDTVTNMRPDRVAVFSFAFVPWLKPHQKRIDEATLPAGDAKFALYARAIETLEDAGYTQIGMDHFALPEDEITKALGRRALSRNFQGYTVLEPGDLVGLGMSAISDVQGLYFQNTKKQGGYAEAIESGSLATERGVALTGEDELRRHVILTLMCNFALDGADVARRFDIDFDAHFATELEKLRELEDEGFVTRDGSSIELTPLGRRFVRNVAMVFDTYLEKQRGEKPVFSRTV